MKTCATYGEQCWHNWFSFIGDFNYIPFKKNRGSLIWFKVIPGTPPFSVSFYGFNGFWTGYWKRTDEGSEIWPHQKRVKPRQKYHGRSAVKTSICGRETQLMWTQQCSLSLPLHNDCGCWLMAEGGKYECNRWDFKIQRQLFIKTDKTTGHLFTCWSVNVPQLFFVLWRCQVLALLFTCLAGAVVAGLHQQGLSLVDGGALHPFLSTPLPHHGPIWTGGGGRGEGTGQKAQQGQ